MKYSVMEKKQDFTFWTQKYRDAKDDPLRNTPIEEYDSPKTKESIKRIKKEYEKAKIKVAEMSPQEIEKIKFNFSEAIYKVLELFTPNIQGYSISRNQRLIIDNFVFGKVLDILSYSLKGLGISLSNFYFTTNKKDSYDPKKLIEILHELSDELNKRDFKSYFELEEFAENYFNKISELWQNENEKSSKTS